MSPWGGMKLTIDLLTAKGACAEGLAWFTTRFRYEADYQAVLDALVEADRPDWARWCLIHIGRTGVQPPYPSRSASLPGSAHGGLRALKSASSSVRRFAMRNDSLRTWRFRPARVIETTEVMS